MRWWLPLARRDVVAAFGAGVFHLERRFGSVFAVSSPQMLVSEGGLSLARAGCIPVSGVCMWKTVPQRTVPSPRDAEANEELAQGCLGLSPPPPFPHLPGRLKEATPIPWVPNATQSL